MVPRRKHSTMVDEVVMPWIKKNVADGVHTPSGLGRYGFGVENG